MNLKHIAITALLAVASAAAWAQQPLPQGGPGGAGPQRPGGPPQGDMTAENFFPPEMVMQNQRAIDLKDDQQAAIRAEMQKAMARFTDLQWQQSAEQETMTALVKAPQPDEKQVLAQMDKLLAIENEIKKMHLSLLIKVKNILTPEQQAKLRELRPAAVPQRLGPSARPGRPPAGGPGQSSDRPRRPTAEAPLPPPDAPER